ncbi:MAG: endonuclease/exonuclease/phosphatase family protein, partial [Kiritimatiellae bacterium]|nr:endonuclease/exonuclease/phosphatase family protein [Kiritimatiellia bacterium]
AAMSRRVPPVSEAPVPGSVVFCSWNMEWFPSGWPEPQPPKEEARRIAVAAADLRSQAVPDVLLVQEIRDEETCRSFASKLGGGLGLAVCSGFSYTPTNRSLQQLAIFSRLPVEDSGSERWAARDFVFPPRGFAWAVLRAPGGLNVAVFDVHLKSNYVPEGLDAEKQAVLNRLKREISAEGLVRRIREIAAAHPSADGSPAAVVLAGDFNTALEDPRFAEEKTLRTVVEAGLADAFAEIPEADRPTLPANDFYPPATFDHVFHSGLGAPVRRWVGESSTISDHCPVFVSWVPGAGAAAPAGAEHAAAGSEAR